MSFDMSVLGLCGQGHARLVDPVVQAVQDALRVCPEIDDKGREDILRTVRGAHPNADLHPPLVLRARGDAWMEALRVPTVLVPANPLNLTVYEASLKRVLKSLVTPTVQRDAHYPVVWFTSDTAAVAFMQQNVENTSVHSIMGAGSAVVVEVYDPYGPDGRRIADRFNLTLVQKLAFMLVALLHPAMRDRIDRENPRTVEEWLANRGRLRLHSVRSIFHHFIKHISVGPDNGSSRMDRVHCRTYIPSPCDESLDMFTNYMGRLFDELFDTGRMHLYLRDTLEQACVNSVTIGVRYPELGINGYAFLQMLVMWIFYRALMWLSSDKIRDMGFLSFIEIAMYGQPIPGATAEARTLLAEMYTMMYTGTFSRDGHIYAQFCSKSAGSAKHNPRPMSSRRFVQLLMQLSKAAEDQHSHGDKVDRFVFPDVGLATGEYIEPFRYCPIQRVDHTEVQQLVKRGVFSPRDPTGLGSESVGVLIADLHARDIQPYVEQILNTATDVRAIVSNVLIPASKSAKFTTGGQLGCMVRFDSSDDLHLFNVYAAVLDMEAPQYELISASVAYDACITRGALLVNYLAARMLQVRNVEDSLMRLYLSVSDFRRLATEFHADIPEQIQLERPADHATNIYSSLDLCRSKFTLRRGANYEATIEIVSLFCTSDRFLEMLSLTAEAQRQQHVTTGQDAIPIPELTSVLLSRFLNGCTVARWVITFEGALYIRHIMGVARWQSLFDAMRRRAPDGFFGDFGVDFFNGQLVHADEYLSGAKLADVVLSLRRSTEVDIIDLGDEPLRCIPMNRNKEETDMWWTNAFQDASRVTGKLISIDATCALDVVKIALDHPILCIGAKLMCCIIPLLDVRHSDRVRLIPQRSQPLQVSMGVISGNMTASSSSSTSSTTQVSASYSELVGRVLKVSLDPRGGGNRGLVQTNALGLLPVMQPHLYQSELFRVAHSKVLEIHESKVPSIENSMRMDRMKKIFYDCLDDDQKLKRVGKPNSHAGVGAPAVAASSSSSSSSSALKAKAPAVAPIRGPAAMKLVHSSAAAAAAVAAVVPSRERTTSVMGRSDVDPMRMTSLWSRGADVQHHDIDHVMRPESPDTPVHEAVQPEQSAPYSPSDAGALYDQWTNRPSPSYNPTSPPEDFENRGSTNDQGVSDFGSLLQEADSRCPEDELPAKRQKRK
jgi:hypothetical protein